MPNRQPHSTMRNTYSTEEQKRVDAAKTAGWTEIYFDDILHKLVGYPPGYNADNSGCYVKELPPTP